MPEPQTDPHRDAVVNTYRYLRLATIVVTLLLGVSIVVQRTQSTCWQTSISAYYFSSTHAVFVASLCAIGTCLIVYQGNSDTEDVILNYSGFLSFVVAMVPTDRETICGPTGIPAAFDAAPGVRNNIWAVLVAGVAAEAVRIVLTRGTGQVLSPWAKRSTLIGWAVIGVGVLAFFAAPEAFQNYGHTTAAVAMFVGIIAVVLINALSAQAADQPAGYVAAYRTVAGVMAAAIAVIVAIRMALPAFRHLIIAIEVVLILAFIAFWLVQTRELWEVVDRREISRASDPTGR